MAGVICATSRPKRRTYITYFIHLPRDILTYSLKIRFFACLLECSCRLMIDFGANLFVPVLRRKFNEMISFRWWAMQSVLFLTVAQVFAKRSFASVLDFRMQVWYYRILPLCPIRSLLAFFRDSNGLRFCSCAFTIMQKFVHVTFYPVCMLVGKVFWIISESKF